MGKPVLTVCLITYNQAKYIPEAIDTILAQKVNFDWEIIIADDFSTDGTRDILFEYQKKHPDLINLILQDKNVGPATNWLDLLSKAKTEYVLYAEGDDYFVDPTKLQRQVDFLEEHRDFSMCFHPVKVVYEDGSRPEEIFPSREQRSGKKILGLEDLFARNFAQTNSVMYRWRFADGNIKDVFPANVAPGDWFLHVLHAQTGKIGFIDRIMSVYRRHPGGLWWSSQTDIDKIWQKYGLAHLALYTEFKKLCGDNTGYNKIVDEHIFTMLSNLASSDRKNNSTLVRKALKESPETAEIYISEQQSKLADLKAEVKASHEETEGLRHELRQKEQLLERKEQELKMIKSSRTWKLRNKAAKIAGKEAIT